MERILLRRMQALDTTNANYRNWGASRPAAFIFHPIRSNDRNWVDIGRSAFRTQAGKAAAKIALICPRGRL